MSAGNKATEQKRAALPLALVEPASSVELDEHSQKQLEDLKKEFVEAVGGPNQDPKDPEYLHRWEDAKSESDQRFKLLFGWQAFLAQESHANDLRDQIPDQPDSP